MLEGVILACKLGRLEGARKRIYARYERLTRSAFNKKDEAALAFEQHMRINEIDDAVQQLQNNHLIRVAHKYRLVVPPLDEKRGSWEESGFTGKWRLTPKAFIELRKAVRAERKARHEVWQSHIVGISAATGLIGGITGLLSVIFFHATK
jgi:uncharacterized membrane protein